MEQWEFLKFWSFYFETLEKKIPLKGTLPAYGNWFRALEYTDPKTIKAVIIGQDPYHTKGLAHGLAFSVPCHVRSLPPSLRNLFKEYCSDLGYPFPRFGDLTPWAKEGVLLLNTILTVEEGRPLSHAGIGWERLSYEVVRYLSDRAKPVVFILLGNHAQEFEGAIDRAKHAVIQTTHPSPFSANKGFFGSKIFTCTNAFLAEHNIPPINWRLP